MEPVLSTLAIINNDLNTITFDEWNVLKVLCQLLKIFYDVTNEISSENYISITVQCQLKFVQWQKF